MKNIPSPNTIFPIANIKTLTYIKPTIKNKNIIVGDFTYFADTDFEKHVTHHYDFIGDKLIIGNDVWIGKNATILPGVHIGDGAIIGLSSVVASDVPPYTIVAGNPSKIIRKRFDNDLIDLLLKFKWWDKILNK